MQYPEAPSLYAGYEKFDEKKLLQAVEAAKTHGLPFVLKPTHLTAAVGLCRFSCDGHLLEMMNLERNYAGFREYLQKGLELKGEGHLLQRHMNFLLTLPKDRPMPADIMIQVARLIVTAVPATAEG